LKLVLDPMTGLKLVPQQAEPPDLENLQTANQAKPGTC